jgi:hypothetical protein
MFFLRRFFMPDEAPDEQRNLLESPLKVRRELTVSGPHQLGAHAVVHGRGGKGAPAAHDKLGTRTSKGKGRLAAKGRKIGTSSRA